MSANKNLKNARALKNDEFYTQLVDIEKELKNYKEHFEGKVIYCNCDDPRVSNFFHYFSYNFEYLGLKKLITTCYKSLERDFFSRNDSEKAIYLEYTGLKKGERVPDPEDIGIKYLEGDGDFRNEECIELLKEVDIVVTNPPFSLFREYVSQLIEYDKKFIIVGNDNCRTYKECFSFLKENKMWCGFNHIKEFSTTGGSSQKFGNVGWYTNLDYKKRHENLFLHKKYSEKEYQKYDNYDAINIDKVADIPLDYEGAMGVPISFLDKYNPEQFEIVGLIAGNIKGLSGLISSTGKDGPYINGKLRYGRIIIKNKKVIKGE